MLKYEGNYYVALQEAKRKWLLHNPKKTENDWEYIGVAKQDEYIEP